MNDVEPCPFCGGTTYEIICNKSLEAYRVQCENPDCVAIGPYARDAAQAIAFWNTWTAMITERERHD